MVADQLIRQSDGSGVLNEDVGELEFAVSEDHRHWHFFQFMRYELVPSTGGEVVARDQKTGFCLGDRYNIDPSDSLPGEPPMPGVFDVPPSGDWCAQDDPERTNLTMGVSVGYGDDYKALIDGQSIDITDVPEGRYHLVHRVNARVLESDYSNNAASVLLELRRPSGSDDPPTVRVLGVCEDSARCSENAAATTLPDQGPVSSGKYRTDVFEPTVSFRVGEGWVTYSPAEESDNVGLYKQDEEALSFLNGHTVLDPSKLPEEVPVPAPKDMVAWLQEHPYLDAGEPTPANVGGVSGTQLDVVVSPATKDYPQGCTVPCVPGWDLSEGQYAYYFVSGYETRLIVLDVEGETVIVAIEAPEETFEEFLPKAQEVLDTVEWKPEP
jgi:hypothetical protein